MGTHLLIPVNEERFVDGQLRAERVSVLPSNFVEKKIFSPSVATEIAAQKKGLHRLHPPRH